MFAQLFAGRIPKMVLIMHTHTTELLTLKHYHIIGVASLCAGIAFFDFALFIYLSDLLSKVFFDKISELWVSQLHLFTLFGAGYLARPIGGFMLGRLGDTQGRRFALIAGLLGATISTFTIALLPTYSYLGIFASLALITARFFQGFAIGSIVPASWVFTTEHLPSKNLGLGCGIICATCMLFLLALMGLVNFVENTLSSDQMMSYGWRILFLIGGIISLSVALLVRQFDETPIFKSLSTPNKELDSCIDGISLENEPITNNQASSTALHKPTKLETIKSLFKYNSFGFGAAILVSWIIASLSIFIPMLLTPLIVSNFRISMDDIYFGSVIGLIFMMFGAVFFGFLVDRINAGRVLVFGGMFLISQALLFFYHLRAGGELILACFALLGFASGLIGALPSVLTRLFPTKIRLTGIGLSYNLVYSVVGGVLPFALGYASFYFSFAPAVYLTLIGLLAIFISFFVYYIPRSNRDLIR
ncbi:hypothetical protein AAX09_04920 [Moraxella bovoculi]|uniref:Major facilitator superfamily protein n=2 Tax=Moraxella bovoculi TaxID=386891 RepID=A0A066UEU9_9GAMM|nr:hypothetical protein AAX09_04920 [Moraxella bovoculi]KDN25956.1 major facilitator superfamily protein [Moraxella bovoculi 237]